MPIEVERKLSLPPDTYTALVSQLKMRAELRRITDVYYDTADYALAMRDWWLRLRNGQVWYSQLCVGVEGLVVEAEGGTGGLTNNLCSILTFSNFVFKFPEI